MKAVFKNFFRDVLTALAKRKLQQIRPRIVGITGSVGKTSTKESIASVLERRFKIVKSQKNYNTDYGALLTILDQTGGGTSWTKWGKVFVESMKAALKKPDPYDVLIIEMGVDKPGDMSEILKIFSPDVMVFLNVKDVHRAEGQFPNREAIFEEKARAALSVPPEGWVILNIDDPFVRTLVDKLPANLIKIGATEEADIGAKDIVMNAHGLKFTLCFENKEIPVSLPHILGDCHMHVILAAVAVGFVFGMPWKTIEAGLHEYRLPPGRMNKLEGVNHSTLLDSSYNASPDTVEAALHTLSMFNGRKIAALGSMNELGELSDSAHVKIGKLAAEYSDMLIAVGEQGQNMAEGAHRAGMSASMIHVFRTSKEAGQYLSQILEQGDTVLAKGSQNKVRMEHLVKMCMKEPEKARQLLVRQEPYWLTQL